MSSDQKPELVASLEQLQTRYRRQSLEDRLEAVADDLRDIKLQIAIMDAMFGTGLSVDEELLEKVQRARTAIETDDFETLEELINELEQTADSKRASIEQSLTRQLASSLQQVQAMRRLNEKLEVYPQGKLKALEVLLDNWNWKEAATIEDISTFEDQLTECREFGQEMETIYSEAQQAIIEPLIDEGLEDILERILASEPVYLGNLSEETRESLAESDLGEYLNISLG